MNVDPEKSGDLIRDRREKFGDLIRDRRTELGLNQKKLAVQSGIPAADWSRFENGRRMLTRTTMLKIADALGWDRDDVLQALENGDFSKIAVKPTASRTEILQKIAQNLMNLMDFSDPMFAKSLLAVISQIIELSESEEH